MASSAQRHTAECVQIVEGRVWNTVRRRRIGPPDNRYRRLRLDDAGAILTQRGRIRLPRRRESTTVLSHTPESQKTVGENSRNEPALVDRTAQADTRFGSVVFCYESHQSPTKSTLEGRRISDTASPRVGSNPRRCGSPFRFRTCHYLQHRW